MKHQHPKQMLTTKSEEGASVLERVLLEKRGKPAFQSLFFQLPISLHSEYRFSPGPKVEPQVPTA